MNKMERVLLTMLSGVFFVMPVFAQDTPSIVGNSEFYVLNVPIEKIYSHPKGYVTEYRKKVVGTERLYLPLEWFARTTGTEGPLKGQIIKIKQNSLQPYLSLYYKDGKVDHLKLY
ncbi:MAG: hypothetical protein LBB22_04320, partial [Treponema sp.]|nr:hypothetical protein [Treponema sp.]